MYQNTPKLVIVALALAFGGFLASTGHVNALDTIYDGRTGRTEADSFSTCGATACPRVAFRFTSSQNYELINVSSSYFWPTPDCSSYFNVAYASTSEIIATSSAHLFIGGTDPRRWEFSNVNLGSGLSYDFIFSGGCSNSGYIYGTPETAPTTKTPMWGTITGNATTTDYGSSISTPVPVRPASSTQDFGLWHTTTTVSTTTTQTFIDIRYSLTSSSAALASSPLYDAEPLCGGSPCDAEMNFPHTISKTLTLTIGMWYVQGFIKHQNCSFSGCVSSTVIASSDIGSFELGSVGSPYFPPITATTPLTSSTIECTGGTWISDSFCNAIAFLFTPSQDSLNRFADLKTSVQNKPPFGYFTDVSNKIAALSEGTSTYAIIDATTTAAFSTVFTPIRTGLIWILWLMFTFWLFIRIRHLEL